MRLLYRSMLPFVNTITCAVGERRQQHELRLRTHAHTRIRALAGLRYRRSSRCWAGCIVQHTAPPMACRAAHACSSLKPTDTTPHLVPPQGLLGEGALPALRQDSRPGRKPHYVAVGRDGGRNHRLQRDGVNQTRQWVVIIDISLRTDTEQQSRPLYKRPPPRTALATAAAIDRPRAAASLGRSGNFRKLLDLSCRSNRAWSYCSAADAVAPGLHHPLHACGIGPRAPQRTSGRRSPRHHPRLRRRQPPRRCSPRRHAAACTPTAVPLVYADVLRFLARAVSLSDACPAMAGALIATSSSCLAGNSWCQIGISASGSVTLLSEASIPVTSSGPCAAPLR